MKKSIYLLFLTLTVISCADPGYKEVPFGGMKGRVQEVTNRVRMPEMWFAGNTGSDVMSVNKSIYDINGNEICSAIIDTTGVVESEAESLFENGICVRSVNKSYGHIIARLNLSSQKDGILEYLQEMNGRNVRLSVKKTSFLGWHRTEISENGKLTSINVVRTDLKGYPKSLKFMDGQGNILTRETNKYDKRHNIIEKHVLNGNEERIVYTDYISFDEHGNWTQARTYNKHRLPEHIVERDIIYWE